MIRTVGFCLVIMMYVSNLLSMHQRYIEEINFAALSWDEQSLLVYDAVASNDVQHLAHYITCGWRHDASLDIESHPTWTALSWAIFFNHVAQVKVLIAAGANAASRVDNKVSALSFARRYGNREKIITFLEQAGFVPVEPDDESCADKVMKVCGVCCLCVPWLAFVIKEELYT